MRTVRIFASRCVAIGVIGLLGLIACKDDPAAPTVDPPRHEVRFHWSGAAAGSFAVTAQFPQLPVDYTEPVVMSSRGVFSGRPTRTILASRPNSAYRQGGRDDVSINLDQSITGPGRYGANSCPQVAVLRDCFYLNVALGMPAGGGTPAWIIRSAQGQATLTITHWAPERVVATFEGRFEYAPGVSGTPGDTVTITGGFADATNPDGYHWTP
jgi:hypothetical protein